MDNHQFREGIKAALPIVLGYLPVGMAFGVLARKAGLSTFEAGLMSLLVYAGASQFIAVEMLSKGIVWFPIVLTTFFINLRHLLMSSTFSLYLKNTRLSILGLISAQLTDESFALVMSSTSKISNRPKYLLGLQMASQIAWIAGSVGGAFFGVLINHEGYGLPFALTALFICLLVLQVKSHTHLWVMGVTGVFSIFFKGMFPGSWYIFLSALFALGIGMVMNPKAKSSKTLDYD
jgi:4-azaleucine resistance transporter AzlC